MWQDSRHCRTVSSRKSKCAATGAGGKAKAKVVVIKSSHEGIKGDTRSTVQFQTKSDDQMVSSDVDVSEAHRPLKERGQFNALDNAQSYQLDNGMTVICKRVASPVLAVRVRRLPG